MLKLTTLIIRWIARFLGIFLFLFFIWFAIQIGTPDFEVMTNQEIKLFFANMAMLLGLIVVWKYEFIGSIILISAYIYFSIVNYSFWIGPVFPTFLFIGIMHLICWTLDSIGDCEKRNLISRILQK